MKLIQLYKDILDYANLVVDKEGYISIPDDPDRPSPFIIDGKRAVLPTRDHLANPSDEKLIFHPIMEKLLRGKSPVIDRVTRAINVKLNSVLGSLFANLLTIVATPEFHSRFTPEQRTILTHIKDIDDKSAKNFMEVLIANINSRPDTLYVNVFVNKGGAIEGSKYGTTCNISFPFYQQLIAGKINDKKIRVKDKEIWKAMFEFMFEDIAREQAYSTGYHTQVAPFFAPLMLGSYVIAGRLNELVNLYAVYMEDYQNLKFNTDWVDEFIDLDQLWKEARTVPPQDGNDGAIQGLDSTPKPAAPVNTGNGISLHQTMQPQIPSAPEIKKTSEGLDLSSVLNTVPGLMPPPGQYGMYPMQGYGHMPVEQQPSWSAGFNPHAGVIPQHQLQQMQQPNYQYPQQPNYGYQQGPMGYQSQPLGFPQQQMGYPQPHNHPFGYVPQQGFHR